MTTLIDERVEIPPLPSPRARPARRRGRRRLPGAVAVMAGVVWAVWVSEVGRSPIVNPQGLKQFGEFFTAVTSPRLDGEFLRLVFDAMLVTLAYAVLGTVLALAIGVVGGVLAADAWTVDVRRGTRWWQRVLRGGLVPIRSVHEAVYALLLVRILGINPWVAVLAIGLVVIHAGNVGWSVFVHVRIGIPAR